MVVLFLDYFPGQNLFLVFFLTFSKILSMAKKKKNGQRYHYSINRKVEMLNFAAKYCERTQRKCSDRKMVKLIEKELGYCVSHQTSNCSGNMSVDFAQSSSHSSPGLLNDSGIPPSHIINPDGDDRALEYELECSRDAIQNISLFSSQEPTC